MVYTPIELLGTILFAFAVVHTFLVKKFATWAHKYPEGSLQENLLHFLAETEVVFGLWAAVLFMGYSIFGGLSKAIEYIEAQNFTEPKFVLVVMVVAATRPVVKLAETTILAISRLLPFGESTAFFFSSLAIGPLLGSFITEPAAMTLLALLLKERYFDRGISRTLTYAMMGLLFVNVSIGGTLTHFAAPPVLMVASTWKWGTGFMLTNFGWRAVLSCIVSTFVIMLVFRRQIAAIQPPPVKDGYIPNWLTGLHMAFLAAVVFFSHHEDIFFGVFMLFLGLVTATKEYQDSLKLKEGLLVGFFLAGLVTFGSMQRWWLSPLIGSLNDASLHFGATALTAITDNAALTLLGSKVDGLSATMKYALVAGAVSGGGLTVIANAPNPAGVGILQSSPAFGGQGVNPVKLLLGALFPTVTAICFYWLIGPGPAEQSQTPEPTSEQPTEQVEQAEVTPGQLLNASLLRC